MKKRAYRAFAVCLCCLLAAGPAGAQAKPGLKILVIEGEGAINNIRLGTGREPVVEVRDENDKPVSGARVTFTLPESGPGGTFFGASRTLTIETNEQGRAAANGFRPNVQEGRYEIQVTAVSGDRTGSTVITQSNALPAGTVNGKRGFPTKLVIGLAVVAGVIGAIAAATGDDNGQASATPTPGTTITPGVVSVGTPR